MRLRNRNILQVIKQQIAADRPVLWFNSLTLALLIALAFYAKVFDQGEGIVLLFEDPFIQTRPYIGILTGVSEIFWCFSVAICTFSLILLKKIRPHGPLDRFLLCSVVGIAILLLDDVFRSTLMLNVFFGIPKPMVYLTYSVAALAYIFTFWHRIVQSTPYLLLLMAALLFMFSTAVDVLHLVGQGAPAMLEDGTKLLGLVNLILYFWHVCQREIFRALRAVQHEAI
ncbi:MAG: hypothetical protein F6K19_08205 [Cyanothece sp. SIO1E1]|nr:hypothetical protein [Cyanothece sp. SIO1E1]